MSEDIDKQVEAYKNYVEIGSTGINRWGNDVYEEFLPQLRFPRAARVFQEMASNDATIGAVLYMSEQLVKRAGWKVEPASDGSRDKDAAKFLQECMEDMNKPWDDVIDDVLSVFTYGFSFLEQVYKVRGGPRQTSPRYRSKFSDGRIGWRKMPIRSQHTLDGWEFSEDGSVRAFIQVAPPHYDRVVIPMERGLLFRTTAARDNPEGRSLLRNAYRSWYFKKRIEEIEGIGIERDLAGLPVLLPPDGVALWEPDNPVATQQRAIAEKIVSNVRRDRSEGVVLPHGWEFKLLSTGGSRQFDTNGIINRYDQRIAITMLADLVMLGSNKAGSFALADVKQGLLAASLEAQTARIASVFNTYAVPRLFNINGITDITDYPKIQPGEIETPDIKELSFLLRAAGLDVTKDLELMNFVRTLISISPLSAEEFNNIYGKPIQVNTEDKTTSSQDGEDTPKGLKADAGDVVRRSLNDNSDFYEGR